MSVKIRTPRKTIVGTPLPRRRASGRLIHCLNFSFTSSRSCPSLPRPRYSTCPQPHIECPHNQDHSSIRRHESSEERLPPSPRSLGYAEGRRRDSERSTWLRHIIEIEISIRLIKSCTPTMDPRRQVRHRLPAPVRRESAVGNEMAAAL